MTNPNRHFPMAVDSTMISAYSACPRLMELSHIDHWKPAGTTSIHLTAGGAFARGLEISRRSYATGTPADESQELGAAALALAFGEDERLDEVKSLPRMLSTFDYYFTQYPLETDPAQILILEQTPAVEFSFAIPLPILHPDTGAPILFCGRCDALVKFAGGVYALDDKTTSSLGPSWSQQWDLRGQFTAYAWALRELGISARGTMIRGISILKTKNETQQAVVSQPDWKIDRWYEQTLAKIRSMVDDYQRGVFRYDLSESCNHYGGCTFRRVCLTPNPDEWLSTYFQYNEWSPLHLAEENAK